MYLLASNYWFDSGRHGVKDEALKVVPVLGWRLAAHPKRQSLVCFSRRLSNGLTISV
jgi:hypothetical protein